MIKFYLCTAVIGITVLLITSCSLFAQHAPSPVLIVGAMKNVMWKGQLHGNIHLDTITNRKHLYGMGPAEYLKGELLIIDGHSYKATVLTDSTMKVEETFDAEAPFFSYANINEWKEYILPDSIQNAKQVEIYLGQSPQSVKQPFLFKLNGKVATAKIHVVNLPKGMTVNSPDDAHTGKTDFALQNEPVEIIGFYSTEHKGIFTHHDTFLHMHVITADRQKMGHLDEITFENSTIKLYLPIE